MLTSPPFVLDRREAQYRRVAGLRLLLDWLTAQPATSWQDRWMASGADAAGERWPEVPARWLRQQGYHSTWRQDALVGALPLAVSADLLRPSLHWLVDGGGARGGLLARTLRHRGAPTASPAWAKPAARTAASRARSPARSATWPRRSSRPKAGHSEHHRR